MIYRLWHRLQVRYWSWMAEWTLPLSPDDDWMERYHDKALFALERLESRSTNGEK